MAIGEAAEFKLGEATRDAFGTALKELGNEFPKVVTVDGDVRNSRRTKAFAERGFNVGIAESNMVDVAGDPQGLLQKYGLTAEAIVAAVDKVRGR